MVSMSVVLLSRISTESVSSLFVSEPTSPAGGSVPGLAASGALVSEQEQQVTTSRITASFFIKAICIQSLQLFCHPINITITATECSFCTRSKILPLLLKFLVQ